MPEKKSKSKATEADATLNSPDKADPAQATTGKEPTGEPQVESVDEPDQAELDQSELDQSQDGRPVRVRTTRNVRRTTEMIAEVVEEYDAPPLMDATESRYPTPVG